MSQQNIEQTKLLSFKAYHLENNGIGRGVITLTDKAAPERPSRLSHIQDNTFRSIYMRYATNDETSDYLRAVELIERYLKGLKGSYKKIDHLAELNSELNRLNTYSMMPEIFNMSIKYDSLIHLSKCDMTVKLRVEKWIRETLIAIENGNYGVNEDISFPLCKILHWEDDKTHWVFKQILENLKDIIISYQDINKVLSGEEKAKFIGKKIFQHAAYLFLMLDERNFTSLPTKEKYQIIADSFDFDTDKDLNFIERIKKETYKVRNPETKSMDKYLNKLNNIIFKNITD
jgi:hypothetical protein